jgi:potassium-dependent mechanosensitive channel
MIFLHRFIALCAFLLLAAHASAQSGSIAEPSAQLAQAEADLRTVDRALDTRVATDDRPMLRSKAQAAQQASAAAVAQLTEQLARLDAQIAGLGEVTAGQTEAPEIRRQRNRIGSERAAVDAAVKRGRLAGVEAGQLLEELDRSAAEQFNETLTSKVRSPLTPGFWHAVLVSLPRDVRRVSLFVSQGADQVRAEWRGRWPWQAVLGLGVAIVILIPLRTRAQRLGHQYLVEGAPGHRVRRSAFALWRVVVGTLSWLLAAAALVQGARWGGLVPDRWSDLLDAFVGASGFAGFTSTVLGAVLMRSHPSWRVAPIENDTANRLRPFSWMLTALAFASILLTSFNTAIGASRAATATAQAAEALLHLLLIGAFLFVLGRIRARRTDPDAPQETTASVGVAMLTLVAWLAVGAAAIALSLGYIELSLFIAQFLAWATILGAAFYLVSHVIDDVATTMFTRQSRLGRTLTRGLGLRGSVIDQFGLILSGLLRLVLVLIALGLLLSPFGAGGGIGTLFNRLGTLAQGVDIGGVAISPGAILRGLIVLLLGLGLVRLFMQWLEKRYLPATDLDGSGRNSVSLVARYVGVALVAIWALASLGIGVERVALLLSALSVGIGFGLQAITQNFVSGLILLAERPIKIGDLVRVGTDEGDVKRISVRSTEIELADHSTLIVPNSELITKTVLNKTLANPLGRIQIQFSVPLEGDAQQVRQIVLDAFAAEPAVLAEPAPSVFIDAIADGRILFNCFAHVGNPRAAYGARSNILMALLARFREEDIDIGTVPQRLELMRDDHDALGRPLPPEQEGPPPPRA